MDKRQHPRLHSLRATEPLFFKGGYAPRIWTRKPSQIWTAGTVNCRWFPPPATTLFCEKAPQIFAKLRSAATRP
jgi:hypothetical protein